MLQEGWRYSPHHEGRAEGPFTSTDHTRTALACHTIEPAKGTTVARVYNDELLPAFLAVEDMLEALIDI